MFDVSAKIRVIASGAKQSLESVHGRLEIPAFAGMTRCPRLAGDSGLRRNDEVSAVGWRFRPLLE